MSLFYLFLRDAISENAIWVMESVTRGKSAARRRHKWDELLVHFAVGWRISITKREYGVRFGRENFHART